jgi:hypothetical protein
VLDGHGDNAQPIVFLYSKVFNRESPRVFNTAREPTGRIFGERVTGILKLEKHSHLVNGEKHKEP